MKAREAWVKASLKLAPNILGVTDDVLLEFGRLVPRVMFVCLHNAGRSQMAAALFNRHARGLAWADSAGTRPATRVHPEVVAVMREIGVDLTATKPRLMTAGLADGAVRVITMGCGDGECPVVTAPVEDWGLADPAGRSLAEVRAIRDEIDKRVRSLVSSLAI